MPIVLVRNKSSYVSSKNVKKVVLGGTGSVLSGSRKSKESILSTKSPGVAVYLPGHAFIYLGKDENGVMHMVHSYGTKYSNGKIRSIFKNEISSISTYADSKDTFLGYSTIIKDFYKLD